ncbi:hypothetical protein SLEP1_g51773 [Rubroshorea leprosula]|uniref:Secreted protein n=1 Tax=Rubroshorea leprosula TaxID=152421 RepID=A0AAV5M5U0_9ROSI|nr:hypothetical protein SLEP1_g51773 [Rubroshorea leprosula]
MLLLISVTQLCSDEEAAALLQFRTSTSINNTASDSELWGRPKSVRRQGGEHNATAQPGWRNYRTTFVSILFFGFVLFSDSLCLGDQDSSAPSTQSAVQLALHWDWFC